jgi:hypothetical protein
MSRPRRYRALLGYGILACAVLVAPVVHASGLAPGDATAAQKKEAIEHFDAGKRAAEANNWDKAVTELRASLDVVDSPNTRLLLARAMRDSGQVEDAWVQYGQTVDSATALALKDDHYAKTADAAKAERGALETQLAFVVVDVKNAPADAVLKAGGRTIPREQWGTPVLVPPGTVDVTIADASGKELATKTVAATIGDHTPVALDAQPPPPPAVVPPSPPAQDDIPPSDRPQVETPSTTGGRARLRPYAYIAGGVGAAGLLVLAISGGMEKSTYNGLVSACPGDRCPPGKASDISSAKTEQVLANVGLGVGLAGVAAGATLFVLSLGGHAPSPPAGGTSLVVTPNFIGLRGAL